MEGAPSPSLSQWLQRATEGERRRAVATASLVRMIGATLFLVLSLVLWQASGLAAAAVHVPLLAAYTGLAAALWGVRRRSWATRIASAATLIDVLAVFAIQSMVLPLSGFPAGLAGLTLGPFAVLVALSGHSLQGPAIFVTAAAATAAQARLMAEAAMSVGTIISAALVLFLMAILTQAAAHRRRYLAGDLLEAERARKQDSGRMHEMDEARQTIERILGEARAQNDRLERLQQDKDSLVQLFVHDLRGPLNTVTLSLEYLSRHLPSRSENPEAWEALTDARTTAHRLEGMITEILETARLEEGRLTLQPTAVEIQALLERVCRLHVLGAREKDVTVEVETASSLELWGDARLLSRVFENLLSNAVRHTPRGGRVLLLAAPEGDGCRLSMHNNGPPITDGDRERIFEKFQQGDGARLGGWGLGLYFCRLAVEAHGGRIVVEDVPGWPTSFVIRLPAAPHPIIRA